MGIISPHQLQGDTDTEQVTQARLNKAVPAYFQNSGRFQLALVSSLFTTIEAVYQFKASVTQPTYFGRNRAIKRKDNIFLII